MIDALATAGADAVKFQTHIASAESTPAEPWRVKFSRQDATRYDYWKRMEFSESQWHDLKAHAVDRGLAFLSSAFSVEAVELLTRVGLAAWKVASGEVNNGPLFAKMTATKWPVLLSTGMSDWSEIETAVARLRSVGVPFAVMQCTSAYPCPADRVGLNVLDELRRRFGCAVGLSDHSGVIYPCLAAATLGAEVLEAHVTLSRESFGPDVPSSLTTAEFKQMVEGVRFIEQMRAHPIDKDEQARELAPMRNLFTKSLVVRASLSAGALLQESDLALKKPGTGIPAARLHEVIGRRLKRSVSAESLLQEDDLENE